jgi:predicted NUDIX family phosphoesterase
MTTPDELVLVIPRDDVPGGLGWQGVVQRPFAPVLAAVQEHGSFRPRGKVETDPSLKQIIPYLLLRDGERIFLMKRTSAGGDERLHERYSIGVGGHVNPGDADVLGGLNREWREEIAADFVPEFEPLGLLNDDSNPVGAVHLGLVYAADAAGRPVAIRETHKLSGEFVPMEAVAAVREKLETWSALLFDFLSD